jgi:hypothetical protein
MGSVTPSFIFITSRKRSANPNTTFSGAAERLSVAA